MVEEEEDEETLLAKNILQILVDTKKKIDKAFTDLGFDASCFDVDIKLRIKIDDKVLEVKEKWKNVLHEEG